MIIHVKAIVGAISGGKITIGHAKVYSLLNCVNTFGNFFICSIMKNRM